MHCNGLTRVPVCRCHMTTQLHVMHDARSLAIIPGTPSPVRAVLPPSPTAACHRCGLLPTAGLPCEPPQQHHAQTPARYTKGTPQLPYTQLSCTWQATGSAMMYASGCFLAYMCPYIWHCRLPLSRSSSQARTLTIDQYCLIFWSSARAAASAAALDSSRCLRNSSI